VAARPPPTLRTPLLPLNPTPTPVPPTPNLANLIPPLPQPLPQLPPIPQPPQPQLPTIPVPTVGGQNAAVVQLGANLTLTQGGDLIVRSIFEGDYKATTRSGPQATATVGVGPSVSANAITQQVLAEIGDVALITGTEVNGAARSDIQVQASGHYHATSDATAGASNAINVPAAAAFNYNKLDTIARTIGSIGLSEINGDLLVDATHDAITKPTAHNDSGVGGAPRIGGGGAGWLCGIGSAP